MTLPKDPIKREEYKRKQCIIQKQIRSDPNSVFKSLEYRQKMSQRMKGRILTEEWKRKIGDAHRGQKSWMYGKKRSEEARRKTSEKVRGEKNPNFGKIAPPEVRRKQSLAHLGKKHSPETKAKMSASRSGERHHFYGKTFSDELKLKLRQAKLGKKATAETKLKMRMATMARLSKQHGQIFPSYNFEACKFFEQLNKVLGLNGLHGENGGEYYIKELGYWVDYYEPSLNLVIEWDEPHHERQKDKDLIRQREIESYLGCLFIRVTHKTASVEYIKSVLASTFGCISCATARS